MIKAKPWEIGRRVIYRAPRETRNLWGGFKSPDIYCQEEGILVGFDYRDDMVLVQYYGDTEPRRTKVNCLTWKE